MGRMTAAVKGLMGRLRRQRTQALTSKAKSRSPLANAEPIPADPAEHAQDFGLRYDEPIERCVPKRMRQLGVPEDQIGMIDPDCDYRLAAFHHWETNGGGVTIQGRINVNSGVFNPDLLEGRASPEAAQLRRKSRVRDRLDAVIAHEHTEGLNVTAVGRFDAAHALTEVEVPNTLLPISEGGRNLLRAIAGRDRAREG